MDVYHGTSIFVHGRLVNGRTTCHQSVTYSACTNIPKQLYHFYRVLVRPDMVDSELTGDATTFDLGSRFLNSE